MGLEPVPPFEHCEGSLFVSYSVHPVECRSSPPVCMQPELAPGCSCSRCSVGSPLGDSDKANFDQIFPAPPKR